MGGFARQVPLDGDLHSLFSRPATLLSETTSYPSVTACASNCRHTRYADKSSLGLESLPRTLHHSQVDLQLS